MTNNFRRHDTTRFRTDQIVSPLIDTYLQAIARLNFFSRRLALARQHGIERAIKGYEFHVVRSLDLLWEAQEKLKQRAKRK